MSIKIHTNGHDKLRVKVLRHESSNTGKRELSLHRQTFINSLCYTILLRFYFHISCAAVRLKLFHSHNLRQLLHLRSFSSFFLLRELRHRRCFFLSSLKKHFCNFHFCSIDLFLERSRVETYIVSRSFSVELNFKCSYDCATSDSRNAAAAFAVRCGRKSFLCSTSMFRSPTFWKIHYNESSFENNEFMIHYTSSCWIFIFSV